MSKPITLDQQIEAYGSNPTASQTGENSLIPAKLGLEPLGGGVRVTARDEDGRTLWGFVASEPMLASRECLVAIYDRLLEMLAERGAAPRKKGPSDLKEIVDQSIADLDELVRIAESYKKKLTVKSASEATARRAELVSSVTRDAIITLKQGAPGVT